MLARQSDPVADDAVIGKALQQVVVDHPNIVAVVGQRNPAERTDGATKQRPQEGLGEYGDLECACNAALVGVGADKIPVIEHHRAAVHKADHGFYVLHDRAAAGIHQRIDIRFALRRHLLKAVTGGDVAVHQVVRCRLVGNDVRNYAAGQNRRVDFGGIAQQRN
ncbi:hypothetical protein D3C80_1324180 [compost metagenome]